MTGEVPGEAQVEDLIERGESEQVFQHAIKSGGRLEVRFHPENLNPSTRKTGTAYRRMQAEVREQAIKSGGRLQVTSVRP